MFENETVQYLCTKGRIFNGKMKKIVLFVLKQRKLSALDYFSLVLFLICQLLAKYDASIYVCHDLEIIWWMSSHGQAEAHFIFFQSESIAVILVEYNHVPSRQIDNVTFT